MIWRLYFFVVYFLSRNNYNRYSRCGAIMPQTLWRNHEQMWKHYTCTLFYSPCTKFYFPCNSF